MEGVEGVGGVSKEVSGSGAWKECGGTSGSYRMSGMEGVEGVDGEE